MPCAGPTVSLCIDRAQIFRPHSPGSSAEKATQTRSLHAASRTISGLPLTPTAVSNVILRCPRLPQEMHSLLQAPQIQRKVPLLQKYKTKTGAPRVYNTQKYIFCAQRTHLRPGGRDDFDFQTRREAGEIRWHVNLFKVRLSPASVRLSPSPQSVVAQSDSAPRLSQAQPLASVRRSPVRLSPSPLPNTTHSAKEELREPLTLARWPGRVRKSLDLGLRLLQVRCMSGLS
eukprot:gene17153-biopygen3841